MCVRQLKCQLVMAICAVLAAAAALGSSTYAWYVQNAQVTATSVDIHTVTSYSLLIKRTIPGSVYSTTTALNGGTTLVPVSTLGRLQDSGGSWTDNADGTKNTYQKNDVIFCKWNEWDEEGKVKSFVEVGKHTKDLMNDGINPVYYSTLYYSDSVYLWAGQSSKIYFDNLATGIYDAASGALLSFGDVTDPSTLALLKTMRVGLMVTQNEGEANESNRFFVYQFRDDQIDVTGKNTYTTTVAHNGHEVDGITYAADPNGTGTLSDHIDNVVAGGKIPIITDCMADGNSGGLAAVYHDLSTGKISQAIADVHANEEIKVDIYLWMEGCDWDTTAGNTGSFSTTIEGIQFGFCLGIPD